jgi:PAS domain S-box-containing protein
MAFSSIKTKMTLSVFLLVLFLALVTAGFTLLYFERNIKGIISSQQFSHLFYTAMKYFLFCGIAATLFSALLAWAVMTHLTAPLLALTQYIKNVAERKVLQKPAPVISGDEVGPLALAFNTLLEDLAQQKAFSENLVKCSAIPTFVIDSNHKLLVWNLAMEELTGIKSLDILGTDGHMDAFYDKRMQTLADIAIDENFEELARRYSIISESLLIPNGWHAEGWIKNLNGRDRYLLIETTPIYNNKRELVAAIECLQDITEKAQMTEALKESEYKFKCIAEQIGTILETTEDKRDEN